MNGQRVYPIGSKSLADTRLETHIGRIAAERQELNGNSYSGNHDFKGPANIRTQERKLLLTDLGCPFFPKEGGRACFA